MNNELEEYLEFAKDIAKHAGEIMLKYFKQNNGASYKGDKTIVTLADEDMKTVCHYDSWVGADYNIFKVLQELEAKTYFVGLGSIIRACMCIASGDFSLASIEFSKILS